MALSAIQKVALVLASSVSILLLVLNLESVTTVSSALSVTAFRQKNTGEGSDVLTVSVQRGSDAFYSLYETREVLFGNVKEANIAMQAALQATTDPRTSNDNVSRAILVFLPANSTHFNKELKAMFLSIAIMRLSQPSHIKTDLIVGTPPSNFEFPKSLGCVEDVRSGFDDSERCTVIEHVPLTQRPGVHVLDKYSNYVDSILVLSEFRHGSAYDLLLRSDMDTFLTPAFATWTMPARLALVTGAGGYNSENVKKHLKWVMESKLGLVDAGLVNIGSTWIGQAAVMISAARLTLAAMEWLHTQEFSEYEINHSGVDGWPYWHWPVILLYGGHIAVNQIPKHQLLVTNSGSSINMDFGSTSKAPLPTTVLHIHCWHTDDQFSKFTFQSGGYSSLDLTPYVNMESSQSLAMTIAISSDRLSSIDFRSIVNDSQRMKLKEWLRITPP